MDFEKYAQKGNMLLDELGMTLGFPEDRKLSGRLLRAVLHALRSKMTIDESFQLLAQLPMALKGVYIEGWKIHQAPKKIRSISDFVRGVVHEDFPVGHHDIQTAKDGENVIRAVFKVLKNHLSEGEVDNIINVMPKKVRPLWTGEAVIN